MNKWLTIACMCFLYSCGSSSAKLNISDSAAFHIDLKDKQHQHSVDSLVEEMKCIRLENSDSAKLSGVQGLGKAIVENNTIYILDEAFSSIKAYDANGKYLFNVGATGLTDDKYLRVEDMVYNPVKKTIWVLCNSPKKIVEYSLNGKFLRKINITFFASAVGIATDNLYYYYSNQNNSAAAQKKNLLITDSNNVVLGRQFDFPPRTNTMFEFTGGISKTNGSLFFNPPYTGSYYQLKPDKIEKKYSVDLGDSGPSGSGSPMRPYLGKSFIESDNYAIFNYQKDGVFRTAVYNTKDKQLYTNDISFNAINFLFNSKVMMQDDHQLVVFLEPKYLQRALKNNATVLKQRFPDAYETLISTDTTGSAPSIVMLKLKLKNS